MQLAIFDLSGTTIEDSGQVPASFLEALHAHGITLTPEFLQTVRGASKREIIRRIVEAQHSSASTDEIYLHFRERLASRYSEGVRLLPGTAQVFEWLHQNNVKIALNTGFDRMITELILAKVPLDRKWMTTTVCADEVAHGRPAPDLIHRSMELSSVNDPAVVANIGDTVLDLQAGNVAMVRWNIGVYSGAHSRDQLLATPHTHILSGIADLPSVLS